MAQFSQRVQILLATYNGAAFLAEQLGSLVAQTHRNWRLLAGDDGSRDSTPEILRAWAAGDERIALALPHPPFHSARDNFLYLMRQAAGAPYTMFCDQDDVWMPDKIGRALAKMLAAEAAWGRETPLLVFTDLQPVDRALTPLHPSLMTYQKLDPRRVAFRQLLVQNVVTGCTMMINGALCRKALALQDAANVVMHDWWLALVAARFGRLVYDEGATVLYRQHENNAVGARDARGPGAVVRRVLHPGAIARSLGRCRRQAAEFCRTYGPELAAEERRVLERFARPGHRGVWFYLQQGILKHGVPNNLGLFLFG